MILSGFKVIYTLENNIDNISQFYATANKVNCFHSSKYVDLLRYISIANFFIIIKSSVFSH